MIFLHIHWLYWCFGCYFSFHKTDKYLTFNAQDTTTLGVVYVRYCGYVVVVKVEGEVDEKVNTLSHQNNELFDQPEGGANALNINRFMNLFALYTFSRLLFYTMFNITINFVCSFIHSIIICNFICLSFNRRENTVFG
jgi:hypothetical protein